MTKLNDLSNFDERFEESICVHRTTTSTEQPVRKISKGRLMVAFHGTVTVQLNDKCYDIPQGYYAWIPKDAAHRIVTSGEVVDVADIVYPTWLIRSKPRKKVHVFPIPTLLRSMLELLEKTDQELFPLDWRYGMLMTLIENLQGRLKYRRRKSLPEKVQDTITFGKMAKWI